jgi:asparagine synthase (glutamine-hydrolysing)
MQFHQALTGNQLAATVSRMNASIAHRGPDDDGIFSDPFLALGIRRLAIIDLVTGSQPMYNEDRSLVIVFNGEIYNFRELKRELLGKGHGFATDSDTEVVLHAYEEYGMDFLDRLDGMFAFALYNLQSHELLVCRDRAGEKPLYYRKTREGFLFGSELKGLLRSGLVDRTLNLHALYQYFQLTYIPSPLSIFENIFKLPAAHYLKVSPTGDIEIKRYWDMTFDPKYVIHDYGQCKRLLRDALFTSVERRMISDVPLGVFLSGGIDSTIITGIMSKLSTLPVETFTIGFHDRRYDESDRARTVSAFHRTNHHVFFLDYREVLEELDTIIGYLDEPFADPSAVPTYMVSKYARKYVKVVLTGDAGDELFAGYSRYLIGHYAELYTMIPGCIRKNLVERLLDYLPNNSNFSRKARKVICNADNTVSEQRLNLMMLGLNSSELKSLMKSFNLSSCNMDFILEYYNKNQNIDELSRVLYTDFKVSLEGDMLTKVDRMSMANSLETRIPLLGKDVVDVAATIPVRYKISGGRQKIILKESFSDLIPPSLSAAWKRGFRVPIGDWLRGHLQPVLSKELDREKIESQGLFEYEFIDRVIREHMSGRIDRSNILWNLIVFQKWAGNYLG